jgi:phosphatidylinositol alpha-1,6-mannosyltransferase
VEQGNAEGFGIALLEAAVFRKPTVGGRSGGIPDAVEDGVTGILVDPLKPEEMARAVIRILKDPELAARLGEAGYERATSEFTWDRVVERILAALSA